MHSAKPQLGFWQIWNMCFGFLGIQFGFALQNANVSRIFQTLGADIDQLPILWVAAPLTGLVVQPIIGYFSDRTWTRLGRRRPFFLAGALLASFALLVMPNSPALWVAAGMLWILDASINVSMEPFRAFVGDNLPASQRTLGFATQTFFIGTGAVVASALPWILANGIGLENTAAAGAIPETVRWSFYLGASVFLLAVMWTVVSSKEYPPEQLAAFAGDAPGESHPAEPSAVAESSKAGSGWIVAGLVFAFAVSYWHWDRQLWILAAGACGYGLLQWLAARLRRRGREDHGLCRFTHDLRNMPPVMRQLAVVQFFAWFALFAMWIYGTSAVTSFHYGTRDAASAAWNEGANWVGVLFAAYNGFAALAAMLIPWMARRFGCRRSHLVNLCLGGLGLASFLLIRDPVWLLLPMVGVGIAWASILSLPYALLAGVLPAAKMGVYMGIFNFFIVIPQLVAASLLALLLRSLAEGEPIYGLLLGGISMVVAGLVTLRVDPSAEP